MLARHAENMFWAGRYLERAEDTARMLQATLRSSVTSGPGAATANHRALLATLRLDDGSDAAAPIGTAALIDRLVARADAPGSIVHSVGQARENLRSLREQIPSELWEHGNRLHLRLRRPDFGDRLANEPFDTLDMVKTSCQTLAGIVATAMARHEGYRFLILGQTLERSLMTCRLLSVRAPLLRDRSYDEMAVTLRSASALEAYQRAYVASGDPNQIVHFLLCSDRFPRAVLYCLRQAEDQLASLSDRQTRPMRLMGQVRSQLEFADFEELLRDLPAQLEHYEDQIRHVAAAIGTQYFRSAEEVDLHSQLLLPGADVTPVAEGQR
ncbi:MAG: alpha-E domain-containing protein [Acidimicrobiales bacterium]